MTVGGNAIGYSLSIFKACSGPDGKPNVVVPRSTSGNQSSVGLSVAFGRLQAVRRIGVMPRDPQDGCAIHHGLQVNLKGVCFLL